MNPDSRLNLRLFFVVVLFGFLSAPVFAQQFAHAGEYMGAINAEYENIQKEQWDYIRAVSKGRGARAVERKRRQLLDANRDARQHIRTMSGYEGDRSYRDSVINYLRLCYDVINEDYGKIVDLEAIAEDSYDLMEAYLAAKEAANDKLDAASDRLTDHQQVFATNHNVNLMRGEDSELTLRLKKAGEVFDYYNDVYLIFFKSFKQEFYIMEAVEKGDLASIMQNQNTLSQYAAEGLAQLDTMRDFDGDQTLKMACRDALKFYLSESVDDVPLLSEYFLAKENMDNIKQAFDAKRPNDRTQEDVDQYNEAVNEFNSAVNAFNVTNDRLNQDRSRIINEFNEVAERFTEAHVL